ncbi:uncharacterized protein LOC110442954 [Mizuhopecten yessoensis]|uniref:Leucine-rich repeat-containing protein 15 n=1 Tax=Mizuhopecten yessoensis TaxID=6573 RepID=A0A210PG35_MIZYE|nr:uncharacterized protein LOC110442954 [Mizuhopecten yessoensis]OWF35448.1 Leucine-rich repeat-containing protein 15 [Mizuhopecten yessoensis]
MELIMVIYISLVIGLFTSSKAADPVGCTYFSSERKYECSARTCSFPLDLTTFDNVPQVLHITDFSGELAASAPIGPTFSNFLSIVTSGFDTRIVPSLVVRCHAGSSVILTAGALAGMNYIKDFRIIDCNIYNIPDEMFADLVELNYLGIEGGAIHSFGFNSFTLLNIYAMSFENSGDSLGTLSIRNCNVTDGKLPNGVLYSLPNVKNIVLENTNIATLQTDMFQVTTKITSLTISNNPLTSIPSGLFNEAAGLLSVEANGIAWDCSCSSLWLFDYAVANNITLRGDFVCSSPAEQSGKRAEEYKTEYCTTVDICGSVSGVAVGSYCLSAWSISNSCVVLISLTISCVALCLAICTRKELSPMIENPDKADTKTKNPTASKTFAAEQFNQKAELTKMKKDDGQVFVQKWEGF